MNCIKRITYIRSGWLPTRQANGIQTVRMCEALAQADVEVSLWYIPSPILMESITDYYGIRVAFRMSPLPRAILPIRKAFTWNGWRKSPFYGHAFLWAGLSVYRACRSASDLYFCREPMVAWWLGRLALPSILEIHTSPQNPFDVNLLLKSANFASTKSVIAVTGHLRRDLVDLGIPDQRMVTLHDGVDLDQDYEVSQEYARKMLHLPTDKNLIVYTGQFRPEKGVETLIRAAPRLPDSLIVLVGGDSASIARLLQLASQHGAENLIFPGYVLPSTARLYQQAADILVLPQSAQSRWSTYYTSPLKLFEYMGSRRAIVATRVPCLMEILEHKRNAWLVDPDDPCSLGDGLSDVCRDQTLRERLATNALQTVQGFSWKNRALAILDVVRKRL